VPQLIQAAETKAKEEADDKAREILIDAMKHGATEYVAEYTVSVVKIADDEVKGRIIEKMDATFAFELATGVDVDLDDQPDKCACLPLIQCVVKLHASRLNVLVRWTHPANSYRRDGSKGHFEIQKITFEEGKRLCHAVGVYNLPADLMQILGRFKYRFSYGQNLIAHTLEETKIGIALAKEVGANVEVVKLGCLLHDIGKVVTEEEGSHVEVGVNLLKKYRIPQVVIDCVEQHHEDVAFTRTSQYLCTLPTQFRSRPGARYENYDEYV
jgi:ribonuclease Y